MKNEPESGHSVSWLIRQVQHGDTDALADLWQRYSQRLLRQARSKLASQSDRFVDEEDVLVSVIDRFFKAAGEGRFAKLNNRDDLWQILVMLTEHKVIDQHRRNTAEKRGGSHPIAASDLPTNLQQIQELVDNGPSPEMVAAFNDNLSWAINRLAEKTRDVALLKLEGYTNKEISERLDVSKSSVERKVRVIRDVWQAQFLPAGRSAI